MGAFKITNRFCPVHPLHKLISKRGGVWVRKRSIFYNALLLTGVNLLLRGVSMVFQVYLSRRIGAAGVGLLQLVLTVETAAITFGLSGTRVAAMYLCAEEYGRRRLDGVRSALTHCLCFGAVCSVVIYGGIMNPSTALIWARTLDWKVLLSYYLTGIPWDLVRGAATALFLWFGAEPMLEKLERIQIKYGLMEHRENAER